jgi:molybdopterin-guanine dinucleotide biosynthesis protein A
MRVQIRQDVAAFVLAGGKSIRMGQDKAFLPWEGQTLLERALEATEAVASLTRIVGAKAKFEAYGSFLEDVFVDRGPLGGIHAALSSTDREFNLVLAVDLPFATPALLTYLIGRARDTPCLATVPRLGGGWEPLCAVYRKEFSKVAEAALKQGHNAIHPLLEDGDDHASGRAGVQAIGVEAISVQAIDEKELAAAGFPARMFRNINTITDLRSCEKQSQGQADSTAPNSKGLNSE